MRGEVDPHGGGVNGIQLHGGMRAKVADAAVAGSTPGRYPPNQVATVMWRVWARPRGPGHGAIAIVGPEDEQRLTTSLTAQQLALIYHAYRLVRQP
ncbi:MAG: hypothetical protein ACRDSH_22985, partial [Pseudonocardiaceae bacterium]